MHCQKGGYHTYVCPKFFKYLHSLLTVQDHKCSTWTLAALTLLLHTRAAMGKRGFPAAGPRLVVPNLLKNCAPSKKVNSTYTYRQI